ncbi:MAG: hypothetical protein NZ926_00910 [Candidatus Methanomethylicia archaeon]|nr:hypothetical protein [Candidatus Methanomethylicia archaeon]MCX8168992.1 hypothetical protein [Candidatus Methanomethylicia archaeon]MDW7988723.1 hypothetical protein [Nitrososphaerota archaeon]
METVIEHVFVGFMVFIILSSSLMFIEQLSHRYDHMFNIPPNMVADYIIDLLAPNNKLNVFTLQALSSNYFIFTKYCWNYDDIKELIMLNNYIFSIHISPSLKVNVDFIDDSLIISSFDNRYMKPCGDEAIVYLFSNNGLKLLNRIYLDNGFGKIKLGFKPIFVIVFVKSLSLFGIGFYGQFNVNIGLYPPGALYLSSIRINDMYYAFDGIIGKQSIILLNNSHIVFQTRILNEITIFNGNLNVTLFAKGFGDLYVKFYLYDLNNNSSIFLAGTSCKIASNEIKEYTFNIPIKTSFHSRIGRLLLNISSINPILLYFGDWNYPSKFALKSNIPIFSKNLIVYSIDLSSINVFWLIWFDKYMKTCEISKIIAPSILVYNCNGSFHVVFLPSLEVSIGYENTNSFLTYRFINFYGYYLLCKITIQRTFFTSNLFNICFFR